MVFDNLSEAELTFLKEVPVLATILVAGADGNIDLDEKKAAKELMRVKSYTAVDELKEFFKEVSDNFPGTLERLTERYPENSKARNGEIREHLKQTQVIFDKMDRFYSEVFVDTVEELARTVAEASGGVLGYLSISKPERRSLHNLAIILAH